MAVRDQLIGELGGDSGKLDQLVPGSPVDIDEGRRVGPKDIAEISDEVVGFVEEDRRAPADHVVDGRLPSVTRLSQLHRALKRVAGAAALNGEFFCLSGWQVIRPGVPPLTAPVLG